MSKDIRIIDLKPWSRGYSIFCFGVGRSNAQYIAEALKKRSQSSITVVNSMSHLGSPNLVTTWNITKSFTTTCHHIGNADIAKFIEECREKYGKIVEYGAVLVEDDNGGLTIRIDNIN